MARLFVLALLAPLLLGSPSPSASVPPVVIVPHAVLESMNAVFTRSNEHWDELADLNTMERMLGTIRPTQREFLGCLQGEVQTGLVRVQSWVPARDMKQLQLAVAGSCDSVPRLIGTWHTHPYRADERNLPIKERQLSAQDLETFGNSRLDLTLVMWDQDSIDAAVRMPDGRVVHPVRVVEREPSAAR